MRGASLILALTILLSVGCQRCDGEEPPAAGGAEGEGAEATGGAEAAPAARGEAPAGVRIAGVPGRFREVGIAIEAHGPGAVRLRRDVVVERANGSAFERVDATGITLRPDCATDAPECVELAPGAELLPPPWSGSTGSAQCRCDDCRPAPAGQYRFVVTTCDGAHRVESEAFALGE